MILLLLILVVIVIKLNIINILWEIWKENVLVKLKIVSV